MTGVAAGSASSLATPSAMALASSSLFLEASALTNLSDNFQHVLSEPSYTKLSEQLHQFVIANHLLMGHIAALSREHIKAETISSTEVGRVLAEVRLNLEDAEKNIRPGHKSVQRLEKSEEPSGPVPHALVMIQNLSHEVLAISSKLKNE